MVLGGGGDYFLNDRLWSDYLLSLICFWHLRTLSKNRTNESDYFLSGSFVVRFYFVWNCVIVCGQISFSVRVYGQISLCLEPCDSLWSDFL